jgi:predicted RNA-binding Zn-ribbon protein involved in translation (DUF1610 family)
MINQSTDGENRVQWESVHKCPKCGHLVNLDETNLRVISTGMIHCPNCNWFGPVHIKIASQEEDDSAD